MAAIMPNYRGTSTIATNDVTSTDSSYFYYDEYEKVETEYKVEREMMKESLQIPSFKVVKNLYNTKKITTFVKNKQQNFNIRNAL